MRNRFAVKRLRLWVFPAFAVIVASAFFLSTVKSGAVPQKTVYFSFDDGPSAVTEQILDILEEYSIKAAFFVIGPQGEKTDKRLKRIYDEGHTIGLHSYCHKYSKIYISSESFIEDIKEEADWIFSVIGEKPRIFRFPGGSTNLTVGSALISNISEKLSTDGYTYYDWNADGCDSICCGISAEEIAANILRCAEGKDEVVVLLHDSSTQKNVPDALKILIEEFKLRGYVFKSIDKMAKPLQFKR